MQSILKIQNGRTEDVPGKRNLGTVPSQDLLQDSGSVGT